MWAALRAAVAGGAMLAAPPAGCNAAQAVGMAPEVAGLLFSSRRRERDTPPDLRPDPLPLGQTEASRFYLLRHDGAGATSGDPFSYAKPPVSAYFAFASSRAASTSTDPLGRPRTAAELDARAHELRVYPALRHQWGIDLAADRRRAYEALLTGSWLTTMDERSPTRPRIDDIVRGLGPWGGNDAHACEALSRVLAAEGARLPSGLLQAEVLWGSDLLHKTAILYLTLLGDRPSDSQVEQAATDAARMVVGDFEYVATAAGGYVASAATAAALGALSAGVGVAGAAAAGYGAATAAASAVAAGVAAAGVGAIVVVVGYVLTGWARGLVGDLESRGGTPGLPSLERSPGVKFSPDAAERYAHRLWQAVRVFRRAGGVSRSVRVQPAPGRG